MVEKHNPTLVIIHSTVPVGTTAKLNKYKNIFVHSPVRGIHPHLYKSIKTFVKFIGFDDWRTKVMAKKHFNKIHLKTIAIFDSRNTEAMKIWDTTIYGVNIALEKEIYRYCQGRKLDFFTVYTLPNITYNKGYQQLKRAHFTKYILEHQPGKIGGHCVLNNLQFLTSAAKRYIIKNNF